VIDEAQRVKKPIGICGQAPSDFPEFARWLVEQGITSMSLNPDTAIRTALVIAARRQNSQWPTHPQCEPDHTRLKELK